jgi:hypothetical protein
MDSQDLENHGVTFWAPFTRPAEIKLLKNLPTAFGVYAILFPLPQARRRGESDIAYIGRAVNQNGVRGRIRQYFHPGPTQSTNLAIGCAFVSPTARFVWGSCPVPILLPRSDWNPISSSSLKENTTNFLHTIGREHST